MEKQIITFSADEQKLTKTGGINCYASNIVSYIEAHFTLGQNWSGYDSVRAVWSNDNNMTVISTVLDSNGYCVVPFEVLKTMGVVKVNLVGSISVSDVLTDRLTTCPCEAVKVTAKAKIEGSETQPITPSQFEQFVAAVISEVEKVTGMTAQAETLPAGSQATARYENGILYLGIPQGIQGERGETGADGNGIASVVYNADYTLTLVFDNGERFTTPPIRGERGPAGADGRDGTDGRDGADGVTPSLSVGTVTTLPSTEDAYVTRTGTDENPVFNFGIPQGPKGDTGEVTMSQLDEATIVQTLSDNEPYHFRATPKCGSRQLDTIVGGTVAWNQLEKSNASTITRNGITWTNNGDGSWVANGTATADSYCDASATFTVPQNHRIFLKGCPTGGSLSTYYLQDGYRVESVSGDIGNGRIFDKTTANSICRMWVKNGVTVNNLVFKPQYFDLTQMFGSTIADYIYNLEQANAGAGVAWFKKYFPKSYYEYNAGELMSVKALRHITRGFNAWDEEWELGYYSAATGEKVASNKYIRCKNFIPVLPNTTYYPETNNFHCLVVYYDADKNYIDYKNYFRNATFTTPSNCHYITFFLSSDYGTTYNNDICINISSDKNGTYEPYVKQSYPLDNSVVLRGIPKLDNGKLYYDGDVYESDGTVTRKYGIVDLGTLSWYKNGDYFYSAGIQNDAKANGFTVNSKGLSPSQGSSGDRLYVGYAATIYAFYSASSTASDFKTAMSGVYLVYELATPTTETATPYTNPQQVESGGTEEYVGAEIAVGHETQYPMTLGDTANGLSNGNYELKLTVSNGKKSVTWQSV